MENCQNSSTLSRDTQKAALCPPTLFEVFINDLLKVVEAVGQGVVVGKTSVAGMSFADDFVGS